MKAKPINWNLIMNYKNILLDMYTKDKISLNRIAMHFNTSPENVKRELVSLGINIRSRKDALELSNSQK